jgi:hypothetical protein
MSQLLDVAIDMKVKLCALWTSFIFCSILSEWFRLHIPGTLEKMSAIGAIPEFRAVSILFGIPILMIFLSVALPAKYNRNLNIIVGGLIFLSLALGKVMRFMISSKFGPPTTSSIPAREAAVSLEVAIAAFAALVVWYAWKWPKTR